MKNLRNFLSVNAGAIFCYCVTALLFVLFVALHQLGIIYLSM
jgi:hypothetical protein|tara:strand:+ start:979 stop:1104 length:126 start_codon:yes stop_codon:yes gene_type:complete